LEEEMSKSPGSKKHLSVKVINGVLSITIGIATLATAARFGGDLEAFDEVTGDVLEPTITNEVVFAKAVARALNDEEEDGTTPVHLMLDAAIVSAVENGAEGIITGDDKLDNLRRERRAAAALSPTEGERG
jgi:hypothetical protein